MFKLKATFEKEVVRVGLSSAVPLAYRGAEEKYELADWLASGSATNINYEKDKIVLEITSDEVRQSPQRRRCYHLVSTMPEAALSEVEEELLETFEHYSSLAAVAGHTKFLPAPQRITATVTGRVKT